MGFLKRIGLLILFIPVLVISILQILWYLFRWVLFGTSMLEGDSLYEKIYCEKWTS